MKENNQINRNSKKGKRGLKRLSDAFSYSMSGILSAFRDEAAFREVVFLALLSFMATFFLARNWIEWVILLLPCFLALCVELINSAIENAIDFTSLQIHPLAKKAKDMGSAAQFFALIFWMMVWGGYMLERFVL